MRLSSHSSVPRRMVITKIDASGLPLWADSDRLVRTAWLRSDQARGWIDSAPHIEPCAMNLWVSMETKCSHI